MLLMIDNYDSFTYNLVQYFQELGEEVVVRRNDQLTSQHIKQLAPTRMVLSPGPCGPEQAGICLPALQEFSGQLPILGVCLGHQAIGAAFGGKVVHAKQLMHGKTCLVHNNGQAAFHGLPKEFTVTRYHSLAIAPESLPACLKRTAWADDQEIMGIAHVEHPTWGVQFHPESIASEHGHALLKNFLAL